MCSRYISPRVKVDVSNKQHFSKMNPMKGTHQDWKSRVDPDANLAGREVTWEDDHYADAVYLYRGLWGVLSVATGFNFPLHQFASWFICSPHFAITLPLLNTSRSQETGSQHWIFYNRTFFLIASAMAFTTLPFMGSSGESETSLEFSKPSH